MNIRHILLAILCSLLICCSSEPKLEFKHIVFRINGFFAAKPILLTSDKITKEGKEVYAYYGLKIVNHEISYGVKRSSAESFLYTGYIHILCNALDNAEGGDLLSDTYEFQTELEIIPGHASGFSTTNIALSNTDFSSNERTFRIGFSIRW